MVSSCSILMQYPTSIVAIYRKGYVPIPFMHSDSEFGEISDKHVFTFYS